MKQRMVFLLLILCQVPLFAQDIIAADRYLELVSERYAGIRDFESTITIRSGNMDMAGSLSYLVPNLLRIDFSRPANQAIVFNGEQLTVYIPDQRVALTQALIRRSGGSAGLSMLRRNYVAAYVTGPHPVPLEGSGERVIRLHLSRRSTGESFTEIILSINPDTRLIRRMEGRTVTGHEIRFDFTNIRINQGLPAQRFIYDPPPGTGVIQNFIFREVE